MYYVHVLWLQCWVLPWRSSCCWPWLARALWGRCTLPTNHWPGSGSTGRFRQRLTQPFLHDHGEIPTWPVFLVPFKKLIYIYILAQDFGQSQILFYFYRTVWDGYPTKSSWHWPTLLENAMPAEMQSMLQIHFNFCLIKLHSFRWIAMLNHWTEEIWRVQKVKTCIE